MRRALTMQHSVVPLAERPRYLQRLRGRRDYYRGARCRFWVFEDVNVAGAFLEFVEASDAATLTQALAGAPDRHTEPARVYGEVELD